MPHKLGHLNIRGRDISKKRTMSIKFSLSSSFVLLYKHATSIGTLNKNELSNHLPNSTHKFASKESKKLLSIDHQETKA